MSLSLNTDPSRSNGIAGLRRDIFAVGRESIDAGLGLDRGVRDLTASEPFDVSTTSPELRAAVGDLKEGGEDAS